MNSNNLFEFSNTCFRTASQWLKYLFWALLLAIPLAVGSLILGFFVLPSLGGFDLYSGRSGRSASLFERLLLVVVLIIGPPVVTLASMGMVSLAIVGGMTSLVLGGTFRIVETIFGKIFGRGRQQDSRVEEAAQRGRPVHLMRNEPEPLLEQPRGILDILPAAMVAAEVERASVARAARIAQSASAPAMQAPQVRRWEEIDQDISMRNNVLRLLNEYNRAEGAHARNRTLGYLRSAYEGRYRAVFPGPAHEIPDVENVLRPAVPLENKDEEQRLSNFNQLFRSENESSSFYDFRAIVMQGQGRKATHMLQRPFTNAEIERLQTNLTVHRDDSEQVKKIKERNRILFDAACNDVDGIVMESMQAPIRLPNGKTYDLLTAVKMINPITGEGQTPERQSRYRLVDIIPNNTLSKAMQYLLEDLAEEAKPIRFDEVKQQDLERQIATMKADASYEPTPPFISNEKSAEFETFYQYLESPRHKDLFSILCRDPLTGKVIQDPVYLPDGYTYDRETVLALLHGRHVALCPFARQVSFRKEDIKTCYSARNLLAEVDGQIQLIKNEQARARVNEEQKRDEEQKREGAASSLAANHAVASVAASVSAEVVPLRPSTPTSEDQNVKLQELYDQYNAHGMSRGSMVRPPLSGFEIKQIKQHLADGDESVKRLFNAACLDVEAHDLIRTPMRFRPRNYQSGETCNLNTALSKCSAQRHLHLIPNNTLAIAYQHLLDAINNQPVVRRQYQISNILRFLDRQSNSSPMFFQPADMAKLERYYQTLSPLQRQLFDDMCKDPITGKIFIDPVYLPDGKTYERSTAELLLQYSERGEVAYIPETNITFTKDDIIGCNHTKKIMKTLKGMANNQQGVASEAKAEEPSLSNRA